MPAEVPSAVRPEWTRTADGTPVLALRGRLDATSTARLWRELEERFQREPVAGLEIDAGGLDYCDGSGMGLLHHLSKGRMTPGAKVNLRDLKPEFDTLFRSYAAAESQAPPAPVERGHGAEEIGRGCLALRADLRAEVTFLGALAGGFATNLVRVRPMRWREVWRVFELAGVNALPIVSLISLLVGLIIAFESAQPLAMFGAQIFIANMIGLIMVRELGPLMTAILLAGRSGSAFAAEIGTMKVNEELNALETMGLDPVRVLVVQRIMAGILLTPLLTLYSMFMGVLGGVLVMLALGFPLTAVYHQMASSVEVSDVLVGLLKGLVFGVIVSAVGCLRGLQTQQGPSAVGESTTRAVVSGILLIILADALFSAVLYVID
jgi:phospholipid/cholesterol/gamma-HCH transport system permease protein